MTDRSIQAEARNLQILTVFALISVIIAIVLQHLLGPLIAVFRSPFDITSATQILGVALIEALPAILFASALSAAEKLFKRMARGEMFTDAVGRGVSGVGSGLVAGAAAMAVITPNLLAWAAGDFGGLNLSHEPQTWVIGVVGLAMTMLGRLLGRAAAMQSELESYV
jgi:hypothetical protein